MGLNRYRCGILWLIAAGLCLSCRPPENISSKIAESEVAREPLPFPGNPHDDIWKTKNRLKKGWTLFEALRAQGLDVNETYDIIKGFKTNLDLRKLRQRSLIQVTWQDRIEPQVLEVEIKLTHTDAVAAAKKSSGEWYSFERTKIPQKVSKAFKGVVKTNLWESAEDAGMNPELIMRLAEVFAWQIDFNREVRSGDRWRLVANQLLVDGESIGWETVKAAEYRAQSEVHTGVYYESADEAVAGFFAPDGQSLKKMFLKSPIRFGKVTSRFNRKRFHPILKRRIPHNGVDYGAPRGTPVHVVGSGVVTFAGYRGASGNMIKIRHNGTYTTSYLHLSRIAKGIKRGAKVAQGKVIGYVGATGRATGPHLHFAFYENGRFVNPQGKKFPSANPVPISLIPEFQNLATSHLNKLPSWNENISWNEKKEASKPQ